MVLAVGYGLLLKLDIGHCVIIATAVPVTLVDVVPITRPCPGADTHS